MRLQHHAAGPTRRPDDRAGDRPDSRPDHRLGDRTGDRLGAGDGLAPEQLPEPRPYAHLAPEDGACLMETASVLAAEPFTDDPRGTDPALAALARAVNDAVGDRTRRALAPLAADLAAARPADRGFTARLVADALCAARDVRPGAASPALREARSRARARRLTGAPRGPLAAARDALWWRGPGRHHLEHALRTLLRAPDAEERLVRLLHQSVTAARRAVAAETGRETGGAPDVTGPPDRPHDTPSSASSATVG